MYLWIAIDASEALKDIRRAALHHNRLLNLDETPFTLPQHVSLKISFPVADGRFDAAVESVSRYLAGQEPFQVKVEGLRRQGDILWIAMEPSTKLHQLHDDLYRMMQEKFEVEPHAFDRCFRFHSTLFMDKDHDRLEQMHTLLAKEPLPEYFCASRYVLGCSEVGKAGTYRVLKTVDNL